MSLIQAHCLTSANTLFFCLFKFTRITLHGNDLHITGIDTRTKSTRSLANKNYTNIQINSFDCERWKYVNRLIVEIYISFSFIIYISWTVDYRLFGVTVRQRISTSFFYTFSQSISFFCGMKNHSQKWKTKSISISHRKYLIRTQ